MINSIFIHNIIKIIYVNFHFLPFRQAMKFPIDVYGKLRVSDVAPFSVLGGIPAKVVSSGKQRVW